MTNFQKALLQSVNNEFSDVPAEQELDIPTLPRAKRTHTMRRSVLIAAAVLVLIGGVFAAYRVTHPIGKVDVETDEMEIFGFHLSEEDDNLYYQLTFNELYVNSDAPQKLETYYLPQNIVSAQDLEAGSCFIEDHDNMLLYYPLRSEQSSDRALTQEEIDQVYSGTDGVHYGWDCDDTFVHFSQTRVIDAADGTPFVNHSFSENLDVQAQYHTIEIDEYSIFSFELIFDDSTSRTWYWTDGDYIFSLSANLSDEDMTALFRSVAPVSTAYPYEESIDENGMPQFKECFDLLP